MLLFFLAADWVYKEKTILTDIKRRIQTIVDPYFSFGLMVLLYLQVIERRFRDSNMDFDYTFQDINDIPGELQEGRTKPWGTGQAVLAAKDVIKTLFIVINADDYYGKEGFKAVHEYLVNGGKSCMACFVLMNNTLSDNCGVTRGICKMSVKVLKTNVTWYGMTYYEDVAAVKDSFKKMLADADLKK